MTSLGHIRSIQDGRNNTDSLCSSLQNVVQILQVNPADGEPLYFYVGCTSDWQYGVGHAADLIDGRSFGAKLNHVRTALTKLLRNSVRLPTLEKGGIDKCVELAICKRFHGDNAARPLSLTPRFSAL